ncbi:hypothetical protein, partial [Paraburkholderia tropica]
PKTTPDRFRQANHLVKNWGCKNGGDHRFFSSRDSFLDDVAASVTPFSTADAQGIGNAVALHKS